MTGAPQPKEREEFKRRAQTLDKRVARLKASNEEKEKELSELKWHLGWTIDFLERERSRQITLPPLSETALDHAYKAREVGR